MKRSWPDGEGHRERERHLPRPEVEGARTFVTVSSSKQCHRGGHGKAGNRTSHRLAGDSGVWVGQVRFALQWGLSGAVQQAAGSAGRPRNVCAIELHRGQQHLHGLGDGRG